MEIEISDNVSENAADQPQFCDLPVPESQPKKSRRHDYTRNTNFIINDYVDSIDFGLLPEGWIRLRHVSGLIIYLHRITRVVTLSRPYSVGPGSVRHHQIPVVALPCLAYRKARGNDESNPCQVCPNNEDTENPSGDPTVDAPREVKPSARHFANKPHRSKDRHTSMRSDAPDSVSPCKGVPDDEDLSMPKLDREEGELSSGEDLEDDDDGAVEPKCPFGQSAKRGRLEPGVTTKSNTHNSESKSKRRGPRGETVVEAEDGVPVASNKPDQSNNTDSVGTVTIGGGRRRRRKRVAAACPRGVAAIEHPPQLSAMEASAGGIVTSASTEAAGISELSSVKTQVFAVKDKEVESLLSVDEIREYCSRLFEIKVEHVQNRRHHKEEDSALTTADSKGPQSRVLMMPEEAKVIRYQLASTDGDPLRRYPKEGMINLTGKSFVCILHEYCQNVIRRPPTYQTVVQENDRNPYQLTVVIDGKPCATGSGQSKKQARLDAARNALVRLIPDFEKIVGSDSQSSGPSPATERDLQLFDSISVMDPRLYELSVRMALPTPYNLLLECLNRSCVPESDLKSNMVSQGRSKHFFTLQLNERSVKVPCKNKREGRHLAAQHLLARLHPEATMWSDLLRMYGPGSKPDKKTELETIQGAQAQEKSAVKTSLIRLLKAKMRELAAQWEESGGSAHPKGKFFVSPDSLPVVTFHPDSKTDLYNSVPDSSSSPALPSSPNPVVSD